MGATFGITLIDRTIAVVIDLITELVLERLQALGVTAGAAIPITGNDTKLPTTAHSIFALCAQIEAFIDSIRAVSITIIV